MVNTNAYKGIQGGRGSGLDQNTHFVHRIDKGSQKNEGCGQGGSNITLSEQVFQS